MDLGKRKIYPDYKGIDLREENQLRLLESIASHHNPDIFPERQTSETHYYYRNAYFSYSDANCLIGILREFKPKRIVEIGAGYSSACFIDCFNILDINPEYTVVDFSRDNFDSLGLHNTKYKKINFINQDAQQIDRSIYNELGDGDLLFIDSSHVSKLNSELHFILFDVLPNLQKGVIIHFHDFFINFEYPQEWIDEGIYWNEQYLVRAFLQYNSEYSILLFSDYMEKKYRDWYEKNMPICLKPHEYFKFGPDKSKPIKHICGQSLYIRKNS